MPKSLRLLIGIAALLFFGFVIADSLGAFDDKPYDEFPHGNHSHFAPKDRNPDVAIGDFPTRPPGPCERITPRGQMMPIPDCVPPAE